MIQPSGRLQGSLTARHDPTTVAMTGTRRFGFRGAQRHAMRFGVPGYGSDSAVAPTTFGQLDFSNTVQSDWLAVVA